MKQFYIYDWAGNCLIMHGSFPDSETAWDYIFGEMTDDLDLNDDDYQEYEVRCV